MAELGYRWALAQVQGEGTAIAKQVVAEWMEGTATPPPACPRVGAGACLCHLCHSLASRPPLARLVHPTAASSSHVLLPPQPHSTAPTHLQRASPRPAPGSERPDPGAPPDSHASRLLRRTPHPVQAWTPGRVCQQ